MRPWQQGTPIEGYTPKIEGQFNSFDEWVTFATRALVEDRTKWAPMICIDANGRRCFQGSQFMRARDEGTFPVRYFWEFEPEPAQ